MVVVKRQQYLPVVEVRQTLVNLVDWDQLHIGREVCKYRDDRLGEAVIKREEPARRRQLHQAAAALRLRRSCCSRSRAWSIASRLAIG